MLLNGKLKLLTIFVFCCISINGFNGEVVSSSSSSSLPSPSSPSPSSNVNSSLSSSSSSTSSVSSPSPFICPEQFGYYEDKNDCSKYFVCVFGDALHETCTGGLYFSAELQTCDWPRNVQCGLETTNDGNSSLFSNVDKGDEDDDVIYDDDGNLSESNKHKLNENSDKSDDGSNNNNNNNNNNGNNSNDSNGNSSNENNGSVNGNVEANANGDHTVDKSLDTFGDNYDGNQSNKSNNNDHNLDSNGHDNNNNDINGQGNNGNEDNLPIIVIDTNLKPDIDKELESLDLQRSRTQLKKNVLNRGNLNQPANFLDYTRNAEPVGRSISGTVPQSNAQNNTNLGEHHLNVNLNKSYHENLKLIELTLPKPGIVPFNTDQNGEKVEEFLGDRNENTRPEKDVLERRTRLIDYDSEPLPDQLTQLPRQPIAEKRRGLSHYQKQRFQQAQHFRNMQHPAFLLVGTSIPVSEKPGPGRSFDETDLILLPIEADSKLDQNEPTRIRPKQTRTTRPRERQYVGVEYVDDFYDEEKRTQRDPAPQNSYAPRPPRPKEYKPLQPRPIVNATRNYPKPLSRAINIPLPAPPQLNAYNSFNSRPSHHQQQPPPPPPPPQNTQQRPPKRQQTNLNKPVPRQYVRPEIPPPPPQPVTPNVYYRPTVPSIPTPNYYTSPAPIIIEKSTPGYHDFREIRPHHNQRNSTTRSRQPANQERPQNQNRNRYEDNRNAGREVYRPTGNYQSQSTPSNNYQPRNNQPSNNYQQNGPPKNNYQPRPKSAGVPSEHGEPFGLNDFEEADIEKIIPNNNQNNHQSNHQNNHHQPSSRRYPPTTIYTTPVTTPVTLPPPPPILTTAAPRTHQVNKLSNRANNAKSPARSPTRPARRPQSVYPTPAPFSAATKCTSSACKLPDCNCGSAENPTKVPTNQIPQIVTITFDDAINDLNWEIYEEIFHNGRTNPNGCPPLGTFYVSHEWTDYGQVQTLYSRGHEMASHGITHSFGEKFPVAQWTREVNGQREILHLYGGVNFEDVRGMRAPFLQIGGNRMFEMLYKANFTYDSSMPVFDNKPPLWPYTLDYAINHECMIAPCPTKSFPGVWEVGMVMWEDLRGGRCSMGDACTNPGDEDGVFEMLMKNFNRHYKTNRAPFSLYYHSAWFNTPHHRRGFSKFVDEILKNPDVYFTTVWQMLQWIRQPTPVSKLAHFEPWNCQKLIEDRPGPCAKPNVCNVASKSGSRFMKTCQPCPSFFPWVGKTGFDSS